MEVNRENLRELFVGFKNLAEGVRSKVTPLWENVATLVPSETSEELYGWLDSFPQFREWFGERQIQNLVEQFYRLRNKRFEMTVGVSVDSIEDDRTGVYGPRFLQMGQAAALFPDSQVFNLLKNGHTLKCFDGQPFFDTDHPVVDETGATVMQSNDMGGAGTPWWLLCTSNVIKPFIYQRRKDMRFVTMDAANDEAVFMRGEIRYGYDTRAVAGFTFPQFAIRSRQPFSAENYDAARTRMSEFFGRGGEPLGLDGDLLVVPPSLEGAAKNLMQAEYLANGASNIYRGTAKILKTALVK